MTCVQLTPYRDAEHGTLYVQANTIIPVPGAENYMIGISGAQDVRDVSAPGSWSRASLDRANDDVTRFARRVGELTLGGLTDELKPDKKSRWSGGNFTWRYYHLWYSRPPWKNWDGMSYHINLTREDRRTPFADKCRAYIELAYPKEYLPEAEILTIERQLKDELQGTDLKKSEDRLAVAYPVGALDEARAETLAGTLKHFIEVITPSINRLENERNEEDVPQE